MNGSVKYFCQSDNKGQLISECLFDNLKFSKKQQQKNWQISVLEY